jgi:hypothetical protein
LFSYLHPFSSSSHYIPFREGSPWTVYSDLNPFKYYYYVARWAESLGHCDNLIISIFILTLLNIIVLIFNTLFLTKPGKFLRIWTFSLQETPCICN